jgi:hypothetical protein
MEPDDYIEDRDDFPEYRAAEEVSELELSNALRTLQMLGDDPYLRMQAVNLSVVDQFIMRLEYDALRKLQDEESLGREGLFLSAQSQMWIFAAYELLRTWRQRAKDVLKWSENGGLEQKIKALERKLGYYHVGRKIRADQLRLVRDDPTMITKIKVDLRITHIPFGNLEHIRVALAKHEVRGEQKSIAYAPGFGRIDQWCGSLGYELEFRHGSLAGTVSRRDIAEGLRAIADRSSAPTDEDLASFDECMRGPPSLPPDP